LAASFLLCYEARRATTTSVRGIHPLFKITVFLNSVMLFSPSEDIGVEITKGIKRQEETLRVFLEGAPPSPSCSATYTMPSRSLASLSPSTSAISLSSVSSATSLPNKTLGEIGPRQMDCSAESQWALVVPSRIFGFLPESCSSRISIPTLHVIGREDRFAEYSHALVKLCRADKAEVMTVNGGHELPRSASARDEFTKLFEFVTLMALVGSR